MTYPHLLLLYISLTQFFLSTCYVTSVIRTSNEYKPLYRGIGDRLGAKREEVVVRSTSRTGLVRQKCSFTYQYSEQVYSDDNGNGLPSVSLRCKCGNSLSGNSYVLQGENVSPCVQSCLAKNNDDSCSNPSNGYYLFDNCCSDCSGTVAYRNALWGTADWNPQGCFEDTPPILKCELMYINNTLNYFYSNGKQAISHGLSCDCGSIRAGWTRTTSGNIEDCFYNCIKQKSGNACNDKDTSMITPALKSCCTSCGGSDGTFQSYSFNGNSLGKQFGCIIASPKPISSATPSPSTIPLLDELRIDTTKPPKDNTKAAGENIKLEVEKELGKDVNVKTKVGKYKPSSSLTTARSSKERRNQPRSTLLDITISRPIRNCLPNKNCAARVIVTSKSTIKEDIIRKAYTKLRSKPGFYQVFNRSLAFIKRKLAGRQYVVIIVFNNTYLRLF